MRSLGQSLTAAALGALLPLSAWAADDRPWEVLERSRQELVESGALAASFTQVYTPAGFSAGDSESGSLALRLPDCLRWDYDEPFPKSFLLCEATAYSWNPGDASGRSQAIDPTREPGLDLLLLATEDLKQRYRARLLERPDGETAVHLEPLAPDEAGLVEAILVLSGPEGRLGRLRYEDLDGNVTEFLLSDYHRLDDRNRFVPPSEITWQTE